MKPRVSHDPCRLTEHDGVRAAGSGQFEARGDQAVADDATRAVPLRLVRLSC
jgi:hypothetical protein